MYVDSITLDHSILYSKRFLKWKTQAAIEKCLNYKIISHASNNRIVIVYVCPGAVNNK